MTEKTSILILKLSAKGLSNEDIAELVDYAPTTVKREIETKVLIDGVLMHRIEWERIQEEKNLVYAVKKKPRAYRTRYKSKNGKALIDTTEMDTSEDYVLNPYYLPTRGLNGN